MQLDNLFHALYLRNQIANTKDIILGMHACLFRECRRISILNGKVMKNDIVMLKEQNVHNLPINKLFLKINIINLSMC